MPSGASSSRDSRRRIDSPTASITSGSIASASCFSPVAIQVGGCSGISVSANSSAHNGGNPAMRPSTWRAVGGVSPL
ncbi:hypothetical protein D9M71_721160 [compost metagenome]